ncbi:MAG: YbaB/EbfC family nucleoid-associated protein [bacterium]|nr:YbaB/EbfC family nucleoid-associated protein [bacterium]
MGKGFDLGGLLKQAQQLQERIAGVQDELAERTAEGRAGGGLVTAVVNGKLEVLSVALDPSLLQQPDQEMLQDLVVAAVNEGIRAAQHLVADEMQKVTGGLPLPFKLPGLG